MVDARNPGQAAGMFDAIAKAVSRLLRTGAVDLSSQAADVDALLEQLLRARHRSIAVSDLLTCLAGAMRSEIGYEFLARANIVGAKAGVAVMGGAANGAPSWVGSSGLEEEDCEDGSMPIATVCRLLELFGKHGYHPGEAMPGCAARALRCSAADERPSSYATCFFSSPPSISKHVSAILLVEAVLLLFLLLLALLLLLLIIIISSSSSSGSIIIIIIILHPPRQCRQQQH